MRIGSDTFHDMWRLPILDSNLPSFLERDGGSKDLSENFILLVVGRVT